MHFSLAVDTHTHAHTLTFFILYFLSNKQMQIETEEGFPRWSNPMNITVDILSSTMPPTTEAGY